jgi:DNA modification methylase
MAKKQNPTPTAPNDNPQPTKAGLSAMPVERVPVGKLKPAAYNPRKISAAAKVGLKNAIDRFGVVQPIVWNKRTGNIVGGHQRFEVLKDMGAAEVDVVTVDLNEADERALNLSLNNAAIQGEWDDGKLEDMLADMIALPDFNVELVHDIRLDTILTKFSADDIDLSGFFDGAEDVVDDAPSADARALTSGGSGDGSGGAESDAVAEEIEEDGPDIAVPDVPDSRLGVVYELGPHRLICGDSTDSETVDRLLMGVDPDSLMMVTDPPYGVEYDPTQREGHFAKGLVLNDDRADWRDAWSLFRGAVAYVWHASTKAGAVAASLSETGFVYRAVPVWVKSSFTFGRGHYHHGYEPCAYAVRKGATAKWIGGRKQSTVWNIAKNARNETGHSTQKPVEAMARPMRNHDFSNIYDPFLGSGTSIIAASELGRVCYGVELSPQYCDVIRKRWTRWALQNGAELGSGALHDANDDHNTGVPK